MKKWILKHQRPEKQSLWEALLAARHIEDTGHFFSQPTVGDLHDPFLFPEMEKAVERLQKAIYARERIVIYGDYDVDGTSGAAILVHTLRFLGGEVSYRVPHRRRDGYGLHLKYVEELLAKNVSVLVTVDCGISCPTEVAAAQAAGMDVIITDHHHIPENPPQAFATIHPQIGSYPFKHLAGSAVAFKLACALLIKTKNQDLIPHFTDLASLGTVADCVPLTGENRDLVKLGLTQMKHTHWDGLKAILQTANAWGGEFSASTIGFQIGPRINAAGRIDDAMWSLQTLLASGEEAMQKSRRLEELNQKRREMTQNMLEEAQTRLTDQPLIIQSDPNWSSGLVGLIAGRLQEQEGKPAFIMEDRGDSLTGSVRSMPGFHAVDALNHVKDLLTGYGGHAQAAGFSLPKTNLQEFTEKLQAYAQTKTPQAELEIDCELHPADINQENIEKLEHFAPFGIGNKRPLFLLKNPIWLDSRPIGKNAQHLKATLKHQNTLLEAVAFNAQPEGHQELLVHLELNEWQDQKRLQAIIVDSKA